MHVVDENQLSRAQGCLIGQLAGDSLGSLVEFQSATEIKSHYPNGVRKLADGGTFNTIAGQPTDDSEMALLLARSLVANESYDPDAAMSAYHLWMESDPFDCGNTIASALRGTLNYDSQANGAMMRISPLGIFGAFQTHEQTAAWARQDAALTHPHPICQQANALFATAIAHAIKTGIDASSLYEYIALQAQSMTVDHSLMQEIVNAADSRPNDFMHQQGWVLIAFRNALWQLLHADSLEEAVVDTVMQGGDTDTNAAICGALLGAVHGIESIPQQWRTAVLNCRPVAGGPNVHRPRPESMWPIDALDLAEQLLDRSLKKSQEAS